MNPTPGLTPTLVASILTSRFGQQDMSGVTAGHFLVCTCKFGTIISDTATNCTRLEVHLLKKMAAPQRFRSMAIKEAGAVET